MSQVVILGLGGQGVVFAARVLAEAAAAAGREVLAFETHGMAQRGGSVVAHVRIGSYRSPVVERGRADLAICLSLTERERARAWLRDGGDLIEAATNMEALGRASRLLAIADPMRAAIESDSRPESREENIAAFVRGLEHEPVPVPRATDH